MNNKPIGVFDSGIGGLTAVKELKKLLPGEDLVYFGDVGRVPYGSRSKETIKKYSLQDIRFLMGYDVKMLIAACGTVSSVLVDDDIKHIPIPFTGVVRPAAKAACEVSKNGKIGVIGTAATIRSGSFVRAIKATRPDAEVTAIACPMFVPLVENGFIERDNLITMLAAERYLSGFEGSGIDTLILGCTHYPVIRDIIDDYFSHKINLIDTGAETAKYAKEFLTKSDMLSSKPEDGGAAYYVSDAIDNFSTVAEIFLGEKIGGSVTQIDLETLG